MQYSPVAGKMVVCYPSGPVVTYDFNANTGVISNQVQVDSVANAYDAEFSPDGSKLYYSGWTALSISQYDFSTNTNTVIFTNNLRGGGLRTGPDGKIYHINNNTGTSLAVINNPNAAGLACGYVDNGFNVGAVIGGLNLPEILAGTIPDIVTGITTGTINNVSCFGGADGKAWASASNGAAPYSYLWSNNATTQDISNLPAGTYSVSVTDANNCSATLSAVVQEPVDGLSLTSTSIDASCAGFADGSIDLTPTGATTPYTYIWSNSSTQEDPNNLSAGSYDVTVTDANGCTATHSESVGEPDALLVTLQATTLACNGDADASIASTVTGGLQLYEYAWSAGDTTPNLRNVGAGNYDVLVTDRNQCIANASIVITEPDSITYTYQVTDVSCYGAGDGSISMTTNGGTGIIDAIWVGGVYPDNVSTGIDAAN